MRQGLIGLMALVIPLSAGGGWNVAFASAEAAGGADSWIGKAAPGFRLSTVDGEREVESDTLFAFSSVTMLVFWTTHCAECVRRLEASQSLHAWGSEDGLNVVGVNFDEQPSAKIRMLARQATPDLIQLYDADGAVTSRYGAGAHSFAVYLVDSRGIVRDARFDPPVDSLAAMKPTLEALIDAAFADDGSSGSSSQTGEVNEGWLADLLAPLQSKLSAHGRARVRWMNIDTTGVGATGAFSEPLKPGTFRTTGLKWSSAMRSVPSFERVDCCG
jgi:peroxiredoxin